ncbi:MAG: rod shape-determining protein MreC [Desertifilum sp. SIO1I2]|nr:rod shape-determining protein MreC [Desertifilum sp. SIO1I2]
MFTLRRWWDRNGLLIVLASLVLGSALYVRQTQAALLFEAYQLVTRPFQSEPSKQEQLMDARMVELQARLVELESQNQQLKDLLDYKSTTKKQGIVAPIVGRSADHWWKQITLGRGSNDGIREGYIVTGTGGVVGRVIGVTPNTSRVLLLSDPSSRVGVTISRSRFMGYMRGQGESNAVMEFFDKVPDVRPGDIVSTSPFSHLFPAGYPVGVVESIDLTKSPAPEAVVKFSAPIGYLEWVIVVENNPRLAEERSGEQPLE